MRKLPDDAKTFAFAKKKDDRSGEERSISNNNDSDKIMGLSGEEFYIGVVIASSASVHSRSEWGWLLYIHPFVLFSHSLARRRRMEGWKLAV